MRVFSSAVKTLISSNAVVGFIIVEINARSGTLRHTNAPSDIVVSGQTYLASGNLQTVEAPRLSQVVDREAYKIVYVDPTYTMRAMFEEGLIGVKVKVTTGFYNTTNGSLNGVSPGDPLLDPNDMIILYHGFVDNHVYSMSDDNEVIVTIECSSPMADLDLVRGFYTSKDSIARYSSTDTAFDQVYDGSRATTYLWGKAGDNSSVSGIGRLFRRIGR